MGKHVATQLSICGFQINCEVKRTNKEFDCILIYNMFVIVMSNDERH